LSATAGIFELNKILTTIETEYAPCLQKMRELQQNAEAATTDTAHKHA
jgi:hypothetical protein